MARPGARGTGARTVRLRPTTATPKTASRTAASCMSTIITGSWCPRAPEPPHGFSLHDNERQIVVPGLVLGLPLALHKACLGASGGHHHRDDAEGHPRQCGRVLEAQPGGGQAMELLRRKMLPWRRHFGFLASDHGRTMGAIRAGVAADGKPLLLPESSGRVPASSLRASGWRGSSLCFVGSSPSPPSRRGTLYAYRGKRPVAEIVLDASPLWHGRLPHVRRRGEVLVCG
jgi:hypothetical protein